MLSIAGAVATCALMLTMILQHLLRVARRADGSDQSADAFLGLAQCEKWAEVYEMIDHGQAGVDDYNRVRAMAEISLCNLACVCCFGGSARA